MSKRRVFLDDEANAFFEEHGYVCLPLLTQGDVAGVQKLYETMDSGIPGKFYVSTHSPKKEYREAVSNHLTDLLNTRLGKHVIDYRPVFSNFMVKHPGKDSGIPFHQDWTFVDEKQFVGMNVWCPLIHSNAANGSMQVLEGSQRIELPIRGRYVHNVIANMDLSEYEDHITTVDLKPGEALIFDTKIIHGSQDNLTDTTRVAVSVISVPKEAELVHYHLPEADVDHLHKFSVDAKFFVENGSDDFQMPEGGEHIEYYHRDDLIPFIENRIKSHFKQHATIS